MAIPTLICPVRRDRSQIDHTATAAAGVAKAANPAADRWNMLKSPSRNPQPSHPMIRSATVPRYRSASIDALLRTISQATTMARNAPAPRIVVAMASRQAALNGVTLGESPLPPTL